MTYALTRKTSPPKLPVASVFVGVRCDDCRGDQVFTVRPGRLFNAATNARGEPDRGWCAACAARRGWIVVP